MLGYKKECDWPETYNTSMCVWEDCWEVKYGLGSQIAEIHQNIHYNSIKGGRWGSVQDMAAPVNYGN